MNVLIYGKPGCGHCTNAVSYCKENGIPYTYKIVGEDITKEQLFEMVGEPVRTIPQIFIQESGFHEYVGGYLDFEKKNVLKMIDRLLN